MFVTLSMRLNVSVQNEHILVRISVSLLTLEKGRGRVERETLCKEGKKTQKDGTGRGGEERKGKGI